MRAIKISLFVSFVTITLISCDLSFGYRPPGIPLSISIDTQGQVTFSVEKDVKLPTPIGTFSVGVILDPAEYFGIKNTLTIRYNNEDHMYNLHGQDFSIEFQKGYYEKVKLSKAGDNILLVLTSIDVIASPIEIISTSTEDAEQNTVFQGIWRGPVDQPGSSNYSTVLVLESCVEENAICGSVDYPELSCGGSITFLGIEYGTYHLQENITYGNCVNEVFIDLFQVEGSSWRAIYFWNGSQGSGDAEAFLEKTD